MAGNTKFYGFERDNKVVLERWGGKAIVDLGSTETVLAFRKACYEELPKNPKPHRSSTVTFAFEENMPAVEARMSAEQAKKLRSILSDIPEASRDDIVKGWLDELNTAVAAYEGYFDMTGEPGVDDGEDSP